MADGFSLYGNKLKMKYVKRARKWQDMFIEKFSYDPDEEYELSLFDNEYLGSVFGSAGHSTERRGGADRSGEGRHLRHRPDGIRPLPDCDGGCVVCEGDGLHALLARPACDPRHHLRCDQLVEYRLQPLLPGLAAQQALQSVRVGAGDDR